MSMTIMLCQAIRLRNPALFPQGISRAAKERTVMDTVKRERLIQLYEELDVAVMVIAVDGGEILFFNRHVCGNICIAPEAIRDQRYIDVFEPDFAGFYAGLADECVDSRVYTKQFFWESKGIWEQVAARKVEWVDRRAAILLSITNITEVRRLEQEYEQMAYYDRLLNLPNGWKLEFDLASLDSFDRAALIHFDIDHFASINELYDWETGDELLKRIRDWLLSTLRKTSRLYRVNDDEFCLFIRDISFEGMKERAEEIIRRFSQPWELPYHENTVTVYCRLEMGIVYGKHVRGDMRNILHRTTHASGQSGKGYSLYSEEMDALLQKQVHLRHDLINCIKDGMRGFSVHYQPIADAKTDQWIGAEALCRWTSPNGESVPSSLFVPEVEKLNMIGELDHWVRETALTQCMEWGLHRRHFFLDMNLSPLQPVTDGFINSFLAVLDRLGYPREKITLEITESAKMKFSSENMEGLCRLRNERITLALDDFGTGYSTFENLAKIPAAVLKTERLFIQSLESDPYYQYLMRLMVDIAHTVGMRLIAEGVETEVQRDLLKSYDVDCLQGYLYAGPLPPESFSKELHRFAD